MTILALDTATETLAVAAARGESRVAHSRHCGLQHAAQLAPLIDRVAADLETTVAQVDLIAVGTGPGSFTGVRIGVATAKGIAAAGRAQLAGVCGLDAMAWEQRHAGGLVVPVIDARKGRFYGACYRDGRRVGPYVDQQPGALAETIRAAAKPGEPVLITGPAAAQLAAATQDGPATGNPPTGTDAGAGHGTVTRGATGRQPAPGPGPAVDWRVDRRHGHTAVLSMLELAADNIVPSPADLKPFYLRRSEAELGITGQPR